MGLKKQFIPAKASQNSQGLARFNGPLLHGPGDFSDSAEPHDMALNTAIFLLGVSLSIVGSCLGEVKK